MNTRPIRRHPSTTARSGPERRSALIRGPGGADPGVGLRRGEMANAGWLSLSNKMRCNKMRSNASIGRAFIRSVDSLLSYLLLALATTESSLDDAEYFDESAKELLCPDTL